MYPRLLHMGFVWVHALHQWTPYSTLSKHSVCFPRPVIYELLILSFKSFLNRIFKVDFQNACNIIKQRQSQDWGREQWRRESDQDIIQHLGLWQRCSLSNFGCELLEANETEVWLLEKFTLLKSRVRRMAVDVCSREYLPVSLCSFVLQKEQTHFKSWLFFPTSPLRKVLDCTHCVHASISAGASLNTEIHIRIQSYVIFSVLKHTTAMGYQTACNILYYLIAMGVVQW